MCALAFLALQICAAQYQAEDGSESGETATLSAIQMLREEFGGWMAEHDRTYNSPTEFNHRFQNFVENKLRVDAHNRRSHSYQMALNQFADLSEEEFQAFLAGHPSTQSWKGWIKALAFKALTFLTNLGPTFIPNAPSKAEGLLTARSYDDLPQKKVDWVAAGALDEPRDQRQCGGCYTFGTVAAVEAAYFIKYGKKIQLSEQHMINCGLASELQLHGCSGGRTDFGNYAVKYGFMLASEFPYVGVDRACVWPHEPVVKAKSYVPAPRNNYDMLMELIKGPIGTAVEWDRNVSFYNKGVFDVKYPIGLISNHYVAIVGFDLTAEPPFILVRNSHGRSWGENGYIRMRLGGPEDVPIAGLGLESFRPILAD